MWYSGCSSSSLSGQDLARAQADGRHALRPEGGVVRAAVVRARLEPGDRRLVETALDDLEELGELGHAPDEEVRVARPDHVEVHVERRLVERDDRVFGVVAGTDEAELLAGPGGEDDRPGRLELGRRKSPDGLEDDRGRAGVVVGAGVDPAVDADAEVVEVPAHDDRLAFQLGIGARPDADDVRGGPLAGDEVGLDLDLDAEVGGEGSLQPERPADEVAPAPADEVEGVVEEIAAGPEDDEALGRLAGAQGAEALALAGLAGLARRREVHLDEADGAPLRGRRDLLLEGPGRARLAPERSGDVGHEQDDFALDVEPGVVVPSVLPGDDAVAGEDETAAGFSRAGAVDGREVAAATGVIDAALRRDDLEADGLLVVGPGLERDLLEPGPVVPARLEAELGHLGGHVLGGAAVLGRAGLAAFEVGSGEERDVGEGLGAVGRRTDDALGGGLVGEAGGSGEGGRSRESGEGGQGDEGREDGDGGKSGGGGGSFHGSFLCPGLPFFVRSGARTASKDGGGGASTVTRSPEGRANSRARAWSMSRGKPPWRTRSP